MCILFVNDLQTRKRLLYFIAGRAFKEGKLARGHSAMLRETPHSQKSLLDEDIVLILQACFLEGVLIDTYVIVK